MEKAERTAELDMCWKLVKECFQFMRDALDNYPDDVKEIQKTAHFMLVWIKNRLAEKDFKRIGKFDIERIWDTEKKNLYRQYGFSEKNGKWL